MTEKAKSNRPEIIRNRRQAGRQAQMSFPSKPFPHGIQFIFHKYDYSKFVSSIKNISNPQANENLGLVTRLTGAEEVATNSIELPFPRTLTDSQNIRVGAFEQGFVGEKIASVVSQSGATVGETASSITEGAKNLLAEVRKKGASLGSMNADQLKAMAGAAFPSINAAQAAVIGGYLLRDVVGGAAQGASVGAGLAVNPQETLTFTGVDLKTFSFTWDLFPSNKEDSDQLRKIVNFIKKQSLPEVSPITGAQNIDRTFLSYPSVVEINLLGVNEAHFVRFKRAMISNITIDYGSGGMVTIMKGGVPASVTLTISFQELNIHTSEDYDEPDGADVGGDTKENQQADSNAS